jgi:lipoprotein-anchoring transpeptidase ErfK/SrfK
MFHLAVSVVGAAVIAAMVALGWTTWQRSRTAARHAEPAPAAGATTAAAPRNYVYLKQPVYYRTTLPVGTVVLDKAQNFLYFVRPNTVAVRYGIGTGPECRDAIGFYRVVQKEAWPGVRVPPGADQLASAGAAGQRSNPLGARAMHLNTEYRIHGTDAPGTIGRLVDAGCFRLTNDDIIDLYEKVPVESRVVVVN